MVDRRNYTIQFRKDTAANWKTWNPTLGEGEPGYDKTFKQFKVGDGVTAWNDLDYQGESEWAGPLSDEAVAEYLTTTGTLTSSALNSEVDRLLPNKVPPLVPPLVASALASDSMPAQAAAAAAATAVTDEIAGRDILDSTDERVPKYGKNLFNKEDVLPECVLSGNGNTTYISNYVVSHYIRVVEGESYSFNAVRHLEFYDRDRVHLPAETFINNGGNNPLTVVVPEGGRFVRVSIGIAYVDSFQAEKGTVSTSYEPYGYDLPKLALTSEQVRPTLDELQVVYSTDKRLPSPSKNLYNTKNKEGGSLNKNTGIVVEHAPYYTSGFIPVTPNTTYTISAPRSTAEYNSLQSFVNFNDTPDMVPFTFTTSSNTYFIRTALLRTADPTFQVEKGSSPTEYSPYGYVIEDLILPEDPKEFPKKLTVNKAGDFLECVSKLGGKDFKLTAELKFNNNKLFNLRSAYLNDSLVSNSGDDVAPIRHQHGTIGANHGFASVGIWPVGTHDKTVEDVGSEWVNSENVKHAILQVDSSGVLYVGKRYSTDSDGVRNSPWVAAEDLFHFAGATHTGFISGSHRTSGQMYPATSPVSQTLWLDNNQITEDGEYTGNELVIKETYGILDYASIYDEVVANPGIPYTELPVKNTVQYTSEWFIKPGGKIEAKISLREIAPTSLRNVGFLQSQVMQGTPNIRTIPGVGVIGGLNWGEGVDLSQLTDSLKVTTQDLLNPITPPLVSIDKTPAVSTYIGINPSKGNVPNSRRLQITPNNLWDIRNTKKNYPNVIDALTPGWEYIEVWGVRGYLSTEETAEVLKYKNSPVEVLERILTL